MSAWKSVVLRPEQQRAVVQFAVRGVPAAQAKQIQARAQELVHQHEAGYLALEPSGFPPARVVAALYQLAQIQPPSVPTRRRLGDLLAQLPAIYLTTGYTASTYEQPHAAVGPAVTGPTLPVTPSVDIARRLRSEDDERYQRQARRQASASAVYETAQRLRPFDQAADQAAEVRIQAIRAAIRKGLEEGAC